MSSDNPFGIQIEALRKSLKQETTPPEVVDEIGDRHGFSDRGGLRRGGRAPSPRTGQVHAKVLPEVSRGIATEARRRGIQQRVIIEEAWTLYNAQS
ncbi:MAG: chromosome partitioning protein ParB [Albidovulum sp.]|nr:chromosome partitioning protein ParB [Albidovulum sp.]